MRLLDRWRRRRYASSARPKAIISEEHRPAEASSTHGVRSCEECGRRWVSYFGELMDSGRLDKLAARTECQVYASWDQTLGLTCAGCGRSLCREHLGPEPQLGDTPQPWDYKCRHCFSPMDVA